MKNDDTIRAGTIGETGRGCNFLAVERSRSAGWMGWSLTLYRQMAYSRAERRRFDHPPVGPMPLIHGLLSSSRVTPSIWTSVDAQAFGALKDSATAAVELSGHFAQSRFVDPLPRGSLRLPVLSSAAP